MAGWHHRLDGLEAEWTPGVGDGQGGLACCDSWGRKESDTTERLNRTELNWTEEGQIYYVRNELSSTMAHFKHERHMSERTVNVRHLCHLLFFLKKEAGTKNWLGFHILVFFFNQEQTAEERVSCDSLPLPNLLHSCFFHPMPFFLAFLIIPSWFMVPQPIPQASQGHPWVLFI